MSRGRLHAALSGDGAAFAPWLWELAADRSGTTVEEMTASASALVPALRNAVELVEADAACVLVDAVDTPPFEALQRLTAMSLPIDVTAVVPGPSRIDADDPDDRDDAVEDLARAVLSAGCTVLAVDEPAPDPTRPGLWRALAKLAEFYGARRLVISGPSARFVLDAGFDAVDEGAGRAGEHVVTSAWAPRPRGDEADALRATSVNIRSRSDGGERSSPHLSSPSTLAP